VSIGNSPEDDRPSAEGLTPVENRSSNRPSVGRTLQYARIEAGLTIDEVSTTTRLRAPIVRAIEQDDFSRCGGAVYARGHIKMLARAVGLDPMDVVAQYDAEHGGRSVPALTAPLFEAERISPERGQPNWTAAMVAAIVAVVGFVGFTAFSGEDTSNRKSTEAEEAVTFEPSTRTPTSPKKPVDETEAEPSDSAIAAAPLDKVTVKLTAADGKSWISAKDHNGRLLFDGLLKRGDSKTFTDKQQIDLVLGNAGAIQLFVNGKQIDNEFQPGQVERLSYTKGDPEFG
jgi:cytoskeletal protein RodZ